MLPSAHHATALPALQDCKRPAGKNIRYRGARWALCRGLLPRLWVERASLGLAHSGGMTESAWNTA